MRDDENVLRLDLLPNLYGLQTQLASQKNLGVRFVMGRVLREFRKLMDKLLFTAHAQTVRELLACCRAWEPDVRILGNVRAADAAAALAYMLPLLESEERFASPPCLECGAMTQEEAGRKCICAGDKDDCHGCRLWPDDN